MLTDAQRLDQAFSILEELAPTEIAIPDRPFDVPWPGPTRLAGRRYRVVWAASVAAVLLAAGIAYQGRRAPGGQEATAIAQTSLPRTTPGPTPPGQIIPIRQREAAHDFILPSFTPQHGAFSSRKMRGKIVVLNYWADWCTPCREETPALARYATGNAGRGVVMAGINVGELSAGAATQILRLPLAYAFYLDRNRVTGTKLGVPLQTLPVTVIIDRQGRIAAMYAGGITTRTLGTVLPKLLDEH